MALTSLFRTPKSVGQQARYLDLLGEYVMEIVHQPGVSYQNSDALSRRPCERDEEEIVCRQCRHIRGENGSRTVHIMRKRKPSATAKLVEKTTEMLKLGSDLSPEAIRLAQQEEVYLRIIMDLLDAGTETTIVHSESRRTTTLR